MSDLHAHGIIDKAKKYLEKVIGIQFPKNKALWIEITKIQEIRNCYVHKDGFVKQGNKALIEYVNQSDYVEFTGELELSINKGFTVHCLELFERLFEQIFSEIRKQRI